MANIFLQSIEPNKPKAVISVGGKFHALHLARALYKLGYLSKIFTSYPWISIKNDVFGIPKDRIICLSFIEPVHRILELIPYLDRKLVSYYMSDFFDRFVSNSELLKNCDIFWGWSGVSLNCIKKIRSNKSAVIIVERGSAHINYQYKVLKEEEERLGLKINLPSKLMVEKENQEYARADFISVPSSFAKETFIQNNTPSQKIISTSLGVDLKVFHPIKKQDNVFRIVTTSARIIKGTHYILEAVNRIISKRKNLELWILGGIEKDIKPFLKKFEGNFKYIGNIPQRSLYKFYSQGSVFILFSLEDGFGMSLLEAMACGLPVICSDATGAKEVVLDGVNGYIIPLRNVDILIEKILYLYKNPDICLQMGKNALKCVRDFFTWEHYEKRIAKNLDHFLKF